nr:protein 4.1b isoform X2 [Misgurnus anguillicaudatus]
MLLCRVNFLDDTHFTWELERHAVGHDLFNNVCEHLNLLERDYFGLAMLDSSNTRMWLDCAKEIRKQIKGPELEFFFNIKFYPPDPSGLAEDITRYLLCLQLRKDILIGRLPCPPDMLAVLGSYTIQSTLGDYDPSVHTNNYVSKILLAPNQNEELEKSVMEQHSTHRSMSPAQADMLFLEYAKTLPMYGVDLHPAKDVSGADVMLGVCSEGLMVYEDEVKINSFSWPNILKISHKRKTFILKIRPSEDELDGDVSFTLPSYKACKQLWKCSVESHAFFRNRLQDTKAKKFLPLGSRFRYHGRTQSECLEASVNINRDPPQFTRIATKRKANDEILEVLKQPVRTEVDDWSLVHDSDKWDIAATSDDVMLESKEVWESKQRADDWFVLLENSKISSSGLQKPPQTGEERKVEIVEDKESEERYEDELVIKRSYKVHMEQEGPVELKVMEGLARDILEKEHPELLGPMNESLTEEILQVNGERIQKVVITKQWVQEGSTFVEPHEDAEIKTERVETVRRHVVITEGGEMLRMESEKPSERLEMMERRLNEVEAIEQKLEEEEEEQVKVDYRSPQTVFLKQPQRDLEDDWFILLDVSSKTSVPVAYPLLRSTSVEVYDERREEVQREKQDQQEEVTLEVRKQQPVILEQRVAQPQRDFEDDWFVIFDVPPKGSVPLAYPLLRSTTVEVYEERREEPQSTAKVEYKQQDQLEVLMLEQRAAKPQRDVEDDWSIAFDVSHKETVPLAYPPLQEASVELYEESKGEVLRRSTRREEERIEMMTVSTEQTMITEKTMRVIQTPQVFPVVPREIDDDWFQLFDQVPYEQKRFLPDFEEKKATEKRVKEERQKKPQQVQVTVEDRRSDSVILEHRLAQATRDVEEDWSVILGGSGEEMTRRTMRVIQTPQEFPVVPREIDDDWFQLFDQVPYEQKRFLPDFEEQKAMERVKEEREKKPQQVQVTVEDRRSDSVILEHRLAQATRDVEEDWSVILGGSGEEMTRKMMRVIQTPQEFPVVPREIDDDWFQMFDQVPYEQRSFPSDVKSRDIWVREPTKDQRIQRTAERVTEERLRGKSVTTEERRVIFEERRERVHIIPQVFPVGVREVEDDWFLLFDVSPKQSVAADVIKVDKRAEEVRRREVERRMEEERRRREEARKMQIKVDDREKRQVIQEKRPVRLRREEEDDWFTLMGVSPKDSVVSPVALPKPRTQILVDQPFTSTPTAQPVSVTKTTYRDRTKDTLDITLESEADESVSIRKSQRWTKRIEGESIYVRHSILMLEDFDVTQEVILRHHESVRELKRIFMEGAPDFGPTEWDRRLSSYSPTPKAQLPHANGEILISMGLIDDGKTVL